MPLYENNKEIPKEIDRHATFNKWLKVLQEGFVGYLIEENQKTLDAINEKYRLGEITAQERKNLIALCVHDYSKPKSNVSSPEQCSQ